MSADAWVGVIAAVVAGVFALRAQQWASRAQSKLDAENRIAASRGKMWEPLIDRIGNLYDKVGRGEAVTPDWIKKEFQPDFFTFLRWVQIYGSDEAVWASHQLMQAMFHAVPSNVLQRLLGELVVAARRDLNHPDSNVTALDIMGLRVSDVYEQAWTGEPLDKVYKTFGWSPPWHSRFRPSRLAFLRRTGARRG